MAAAMRPAWRSSAKSRRMLAEVGLAGVVEQLGRGPAAGLVHPHVERARAVVAVAEAPVGLVHLRGRDAEVGEHGAHVVAPLGRRAPRRARRSGRARPWPGRRTGRGHGGRRPPRSGRGRCRAGGGRDGPSSSARAWPAPPRVRSTKVPSGTTESSSTIGPRRTGSWAKPGSSGTGGGGSSGTGRSVSCVRPFAAPRQVAPPGMSPRVGKRGQRAELE